MANLNLIHFLDFYFTLMFFIGLYMRVGQYREAARLALSGPGRWPHLLEMVRHHRTIFMTWATLLPGLLALILALVQVIASRYIWPHARLTLGELLDHWLALGLITPVGLAMLVVDVYCAYQVGQFDRMEMEKYFDQAEYWLCSQAAHVVRIVTFGYVNPREMVAVEVQKSLRAASQLLQVNLWWLTVQIGLRTAFGLSLWASWLVIS